MKTSVLQLLVAVFGITLVATASELRTNQLMIGDTAVESVETNGTISGDKWIVVSNTLIQVHVEATPLDGPTNAPGDLAIKNESKPCLQLMMATGDGPTKPGGVKGLHGLVYMASDWRTPSLGRTNRIDILSTEDKTKIVVMVRDNGPIYSSTNSGMTWTIINTTGTYEFPLTSGPEGGGFYAKTTIYPSSTTQPLANSTATNWYAVGLAPDGSKMVVTGGSSQETPVLSITQSSNITFVSWPVVFKEFHLQKNNSLTSTNWIDVTNSVVVVGEENQVTIPGISNSVFYRLKSSPTQGR